MLGLTLGATADDLLHIINSTKSEDKKVHKILKVLKKNPRLVESRFTFERTILHYAVLKQLPQLTAALLQAYPTLITLVDRDKRTAFHCAIAVYNPLVLKELIEHSQEGINDREINGNSALLLAVKEKKIEAIVQLVKGNACIYTFDNAGLTPYSIALGNDEVMRALCILNPEQRNISHVFPSMTMRRIKQPDNLDEFTRKFSALSIFQPHDVPKSENKELPVGNIIKEQSSSTARSLDSPQSTSSSSDKSKEGKVLTTKREISDISLEAIELGDVSLLCSYLEAKGDPNVKLFLGRPLILTVFITATNQDKQKSEVVRKRQLLQFYMLIKHAYIGASDNRNKTIIDFVTTPLQMGVIREAYNSLWREAILLVKRTKFNLEKHEIDFENYLFNAGLQKGKYEPVKDFLTIDFHPVNPREAELGRILWDLCAAHKLSSSERAFDKAYLSNIIQGLLFDSTPVEIISIMRQIWPEFDVIQKLVAVFIIKEIIFWDVYHKLPSPEFQVQFDFFKKLIRIDFPLHGSKLGSNLDKMIEIKNELRDSPVYVNYRVLCQWLSRPGLAQHLPSLKEKIKSVVSARTSLDEIQAVAFELRALMLYIFQNVAITEFRQKAWSTKEKEILAPHIMLHAKAINSTSDYVRDLILSAKTLSDKVNMITFFVSVATELSKPINDMGPDYNSIMAITSGLNSSPVSRMKKCFSTLDIETQRKLESLNTLMSFAENARYLRAAEATHVAPLPFLGVKLKDFTFIYEANSLLEQSCEARQSNLAGLLVSQELLGSKLRDFLQFQRELMIVAAVPQTNIFAEVLDGKCLTEEQQAMLSNQVESPRLEIDSLNYASLYEALHQLLKNEIVPKIAYKDKLYSPVEGIKYSAEHMLNLLGKDPNITKQEFDKAKKLLTDMIHCVNKNYGSSINVIFYQQQLSRLCDEKCKAGNDAIMRGPEAPLGTVVPALLLSSGSRTKPSAINARSADKDIIKEMPSKRM